MSPGFYEAGYQEISKVSLDGVKPLLLAPLGEVQVFHAQTKNRIAP